MKPERVERYAERLLERARAFADELCRGSKWLVSFWPLEYWTCPACDGAGVRWVYGPAIIGGRP